MHCPLLALFALVTIATAAPAQQPNSLFISNDVHTNNNLWQPATDAGAGLSGSCTVGASNVHYYTLPFFTDTTDSTYRMQVLYDDLDAGFFYIYRDAFDPQDPCANMYVFHEAPIANVYNIQFDANRQYIFVTSEAQLFGGGGWFHGAIDGPVGSHIQAGGNISPFTSFCEGDGSGAACPCGNAGAAGNGCANSVSSGGARLAVSGTASVSSDTLHLNGAQMPNSFCLYFQGTQPTNGGAGTVFGDGLRCASGTITRIASRLNSAGASGYPGSGDAAISTRGSDTAGDVRYYQCWYRNAAQFCTPSTSNLTNGMMVNWMP